MTFQACLNPRWRSTQAVKKLVWSEQDRAASCSLPRCFQHKLQSVIKAFSPRRICRESNGMLASIPRLSEFSGIPTSQVLLVLINTSPFSRSISKSFQVQKSEKCSELLRLESMLLSPGAQLGWVPYKEPGGACKGRTGPDQLVNELINYSGFIPFLFSTGCAPGVPCVCTRPASLWVMRRSQLHMSDKAAGVHRKLGCDNLPFPDCLHNLWAYGSRRLQRFPFRSRNTTLWEHFVIILPHHRQELNIINMADWYFL